MRIERQSKHTGGLTTIVKASLKDRLVSDWDAYVFDLVSDMGTRYIIRLSKEELKEMAKHLKQNDLEGKG